ncbi:hypothetical protein ACOSQ2_028576 [Xanthoceras sorbifolium]
MSFWNGVTTCLKVFAPLVKVLRLVDGDRKPAMGFVYGELVQAKEEIKVALNNVEGNYRPILDIIDARIKEHCTRLIIVISPKKKTIRVCVDNWP